MTVLGKLVTLGSASIAAGSVAWVVATSQGDPARQQDSANGSGGRAVCVGQDTVLRLVEDGKTCPPGRARLGLAEAEEEDPDWEDAGPEERPGRDTPGSDPLAKLERRVADLEKRALFEVVDKAGRPVFRVAPETVLVFNGAQMAVAAVRATDEGGYFIARSTDGLTTSLGASGVRSGVRISERGVTRSYLGKQAQGNYALTFPSPGSGSIAAIGESRAGTGALVVGNFTGAILASVTASDGKGAIGVSNAGGLPVVSLTEGATRGGLLSIGDATSEAMVRMGVAQDRYGIVLAGPRAGFPLIPGSGLPGSYIMGCAGKGKDCGPDPSLGR
ncbi:MAG: hypothetical protein M3545_06290 [Acidobacteriota bacterium]|nr:hypothetical protein [Acidobacteriota bacterium]